MRKHVVIVMHAQYTMPYVCRWMTCLYYVYMELLFCPVPIKLVKQAIRSNAGECNYREVTKAADSKGECFLQPNHCSYYRCNCSLWSAKSSASRRNCRPEAL